MEHTSTSQPSRTSTKRSGNALVVAAVVTLVGLATAAASTAMTAGPTRVRDGSPPPAEATQLPPPSTHRHGTTVVLLVSDDATAERLRSTHGTSGLIGARGKLEVIVAVARTAEEELRLRSMLLNPTICPAGSCGDLAIIDLRAGSEP